MRRLVLVLAALSLALPVWAQRPAAADYFPLALGHAWTYQLRVKVGDQRRLIEYTTRVARLEEPTPRSAAGVEGEAAERPGEEGIGPCVVLESRSDRRLLLVEWLRRDGERLLLPLRQEGADEAQRRALGERVFLDLALVQAALEAPAGAPRPSWSWSHPDGSGEGTTTIEGLERIHLRNFGMLECLVIVESGRFRLGKSVRLQERRLWLAPDIGPVKELMKITHETGEVTTETEVSLLRHQAP